MLDGKIGRFSMLVVAVGMIMFLLSGLLPYYQLFSFTSAGSLGISTNENVTTTTSTKSGAESANRVDLTDSNPSGEITAYDSVSEVSTAVIGTGVGSSDASAVGSPDGTLGDYSVQVRTTGSTTTGQGGQGTNSNNTTDDGSGISTGASTGTDSSGTAGSGDGLQPDNVDTDNQNPQTSSSESSDEGSGGAGTGSSSSSGSSNSTSSSTDEGTSTSGTASNQTSSSSASSSPAASNQSSISETVSESSRTGSDIGGAIDTKESVSESTDAESVVSEQDFEGTSATNPNSVEHTISPGDGQNVNIGSISNTENVTATISLDKSSYNLGDSPIVTVNDGEANVDPNALNTIQIIVTSSSDPHGILLTLTETGPNTGVFEGPFSFTSDVSSPTDGTIKIGTGDQLGIQYVGTHPRLQVEINGVQQGGSVSLTQVPRPSVENPPFLLGAAVEIAYGPEVQLIPNNALPECVELGDLCDGTMNVEMSYGNIPLCLGTACQNPEALTVWQYLGPDIGWIDLRAYQPPGTSIDVNTDTKIVSAFSPFKGGILSLGVSASGGGGGGGGLALPGAGVVLDLIAPVVEEQEPQPPAGETPTGINPAKDAEDLPAGDAPGSTFGETNDNSTSPQAPSTGTENIADSGTLGTTPGSAKDAISLNTTIAVPGIGNVTLSSANLNLERNFEVTALKDQDLGGLKITKSPDGHTMSVATQNGTKYDVVGPVLNVGPTDLDLNGTLTISIPYDSTQIPNGGNGKMIRLIYYSGSSWEDITVEPFANGKIVTGSLADIGPVAAAIMSK